MYDYSKDGRTDERVYYSFYIVKSEFSPQDIRKDERLDGLKLLKFEIFIDNFNYFRVFKIELFCVKTKI